MYPLPGMIHICTPEYVNIKRLDIYVCVYVLTASHGHTPITKRTINIIQPGILVYTAPGIQQYNTKHEHFGGGTQSGVSHISCMSCLKSKASAKKKKKNFQKKNKKSHYIDYTSPKKRGKPFLLTQWQSHTKSQPIPLGRSLAGCYHLLPLSIAQPTRHRPLRPRAWACLLIAARANRRVMTNYWLLRRCGGPLYQEHGTTTLHLT